MHFIFVLIKKLPNEWRCFCACLNNCFFVLNFSCAVRNCLLIYLLRVSIFAIACVILLLPYFLQCFCALLTWFWGPIPHFCVFCCLHVCLGTGITSWSCAIIPCHILLLVVLWDSYTPFWQKKLVLWWSSRFCRFCWSDSCLLVLALKSASCINLCLLVLIYLCVF